MVGILLLYQILYTRARVRMHGAREFLWNVFSQTMTAGLKPVALPEGVGIYSRVPRPRHCSEWPVVNHMDAKPDHEHARSHKTKVILS